MSGHNPHSHLSQPNSSWNPLQIPSYIPRQPQLAHMSNERPLVRSPLTWHTPTTQTPPEAFYSFLSAANHKNLELNPLLPSFVRGPSPFGSVDLTIQSARNSTTPLSHNLPSPPPPLPHNLPSPPPPPPPPEFSVHNKQQPSSGLPQSPVGQQQQQQIPSSLASNNLNSLPSGPGVIQSTGSVRDKFQTSSNGGNSNGEIQPPQPGSIFVRDARQINDEIAKSIASRDTMEMMPTTNEPVELIKEGPYQPIKTHAAMPTSPKRLSPARPPSISNNTPVSPRSQLLAGPLTTLTNIGSATDIVNNHVTKADSDTAQKSPVEPAPICANSPTTMAQPSSPNNATSNDDSLDSNASRSRRKRKPNKTTRVSNDSDVSQKIDSGSAAGTTQSVRQQEVEQSKTPLQKRETKAGTPGKSVEAINEADSNSASGISNKSDADEQPTSGRIETDNIPSTPASPDEIENPKDDDDQPKSDSQFVQQTSAKEQLDFAKKSNPKNAEQSESDSKSPAATSDHSNVKLNCQGKSEQLQNNATTLDKEPILTKAEDHFVDSPSKRIKRKGDSDDIETIDKIAAMIASTNEETLPMELIVNDPVKDGEKTKQAQSDEKSETTDNGSKITDLTELLETPASDLPPVKEIGNSDRVQTKPNVEENCFEEVETKLEEMFAGIEDEEPTPCIVPSSSVTDTLVDDGVIAAEVITELGLALESPMKAKPSTSSTPTSSPEKLLDEPTIKEPKSPPSQKRQHSNKSDASPPPPKKKRKIAKKSHNNQKSSSAVKSSKTSTISASNSYSNKSISSSSKSNEKMSNSFKEKSSSKDEAATVDYKGPFVHVKSDGMINVINAPVAEDVVEKQNKVKKSIHNHTHSDRNKIRGLHVSTLSTKYDADTADATWMCVFCKRGPHKMGLGDLFGPYIITTTCEGFTYSQKDPKDDEFVSKRTKADMFQKHINGMPAVPAANSSYGVALASVQSAIATTTKKKRKTGDSPSSSSSPTFAAASGNDIYIGMTKVSDTSYEVWLHEDCVVWSPGMYIIGARIVGLDTAVWSSTRYKCNICSKNGAMISCLQRGCTEKAHIPCARIADWTLNEYGFKSTCIKHCPSTSATLS